MSDSLPDFTFGNQTFPGKSATDHFLILGATKSGKTTLIEQLLIDAVTPIGKRPDYRALIYDAKGDTIPFLSSVLPDLSNVRILNAFDRRSNPWDIAADIPNPTIAREMASALCPTSSRSKDGENQFFQDQAVGFIAQAILGLQAVRGKDWNLRDLCNVFRDFKDLEHIFQNTPDGASKIKQFTRTEKTRDNILQSVIRFTDKYSSIAAAWHHSNVEPVSLTQWANEPGKESILVLGYNPDAEESLNQLNQAIFKRAVQLIAKRPNSDAARTWFILDEATQLGELPMISTLHRYCRAKGAAVVLATQSMAGLESVYDKSILEEINSNSGFKALLRTHGYQDARWASDQCGKYIQSRYAIGENDSTSQTSSSSNSYGANGGSSTFGTSSGSTDGKSLSESLVDADNFKPETFMHDMMAPSERRGIDGVFFAELQSDEMSMPNQKAKGKKFWTGPIQSPQFKTIIMSKEQSEVPGFLPIDDKLHELPRWTVEEKTNLLSTKSEIKYQPVTPVEIP